MSRHNARKKPDEVGIGYTMVRMQFYLPRPTVVAIRELAARQGVSYSEMARRAMDKYVSELQNESNNKD